MSDDHDEAPDETLELQPLAALTSEQFEKIQSNAKRIASRFRRKCWWIDRDELEQAAVLEQLKAARNYDPGRGRTGDIEFGAYTWRVAVLAARRSVLKASAPVTAHHRLEVLKGVSHTSLTIMNEQGEERERPELVEPSPWLDDLAQRSEFLARIQARVVELLGEDGAAFAFGVLSDEFRPAEVAAYHNIPAETVYRAARRMKRQLIEDRELWEMWRNDE